MKTQIKHPQSESENKDSLREMYHRLDWFKSGAEWKIGGRHGKAAPRWCRQICFLFYFINIVVIWDLLEEIWKFVINI